MWIDVENRISFMDLETTNNPQDSYFFIFDLDA